MRRAACAVPEFREPAAGFAPRGFLLATAGVDGTVRTFTGAVCGTTPQLVALARRRLAGLAAAHG